MDYWPYTGGFKLEIQIFVWPLKSRGYFDKRGFNKTKGYFGLLGWNQFGA